jgi:hypothetical protein
MFFRTEKDRREKEGERAREGGEEEGIKRMVTGIGETLNKMCMCV